MYTIREWNVTVLQWLLNRYHSLLHLRVPVWWKTAPRGKLDSLLWWSASVVGPLQPAPTSESPPAHTNTSGLDEKGKQTSQRATWNQTWGHCGAVQRAAFLFRLIYSSIWTSVTHSPLDLVFNGFNDASVFTLTQPFCRFEVLEGQPHFLLFKCHHGILQKKKKGKPTLFNETLKLYWHKYWMWTKKYNPGFNFGFPTESRK